ncbi:MAG: cell division protein FtsW [Candidatus Blackburnbacteria bacterium RIFCSPLOWO2_02_FULL_44_9]|nr:MAG: cell division protein FtsW [Candidatus Blackburnbacteria bacterium RIFCSPLOWO2_02_FULL_44_9]
MKLSLRPQKISFDKPLLLAAVGLSIFGLAMVFNASAADGAKTFDDSFFYLKRQAMWATLGMLCMLILSQVNYKVYEKLSVPLLGATLFLLVLVLIPGVGISTLGASRRLALGFFGIQPAELAKLTLTIFLAASLSKKNSLLRFIVPTGLTCLLIVVEPDLGTTIITAGIALTIYFASGAPLMQFFSLCASGGILGLILALTSGYRRERIITYLNPHSDPVNSSYHVRQILIALGSGGLWGRGLGQSRQKHLFLPEPATDSIFAVIAEELGFIGASLVIAVFLFLIVRGLSIAARVNDPFGKLLATGITAWIAIQAFINLSAMVALVPLTGIPLPFISYGGSSLFVSFCAIGILLNISKHAGKTR